MYSPADDLTLALSIASDADLVSAERYRARDLRVERKPDRTFVTDADRAVERLIRDRIAAARPGDGVLGEEYGDDGHRAGRQWIIDPIDGTANYLRGIPVWATLIALAVDGVPVVGVASAPALGLRWWAARGQGAWVDRTDGPFGDAPRRLAVSGVADLADAAMSGNGMQYWDEAGRLDRLVELSRRVWRMPGTSDFWSYMLVAEGALDAVAEFGLAPYDLAALIPVVEEAGGRFTDADGSTGPWGGSAVATNGLLHDAMLEAVR